MSESLPNNGVTAVAHKRYELTTQDRFSMSPSRTPMVGSAGATTVCSSALRNMASMMPAMMERTAGGSSGAWNPSGAGAAVRASAAGCGLIAALNCGADGSFMWAATIRGLYLRVACYR